MTSPSSIGRSRRLWQLTAPVATSAVIAATLSVAAAGTANADPRADKGEGQLTIASSTATPGSTVTVTGTGFDARPAEGAFFGVKLYTPDSGSGSQVALPDGQVCGDELDASGTLYMNNEDCLPMNESGAFSFQLTLPDKLDAGQYEIRILGGQDNGTSVSKHVLFTVEDASTDSNGDASTDADTDASTNNSTGNTADTENTGGDSDNTSTTAEPALAISNVTTASSGQSSITVSVTGFDADAEVTAEANGQALKWSAGRSTADTTTADANGKVNGTVVVPAGVAPAASEYTLTIKQGEKAVTGTFTTATGLTASNGTAAGSDTTFTVTNLPKDAVVTSLTAGDTTVWSGEATADEDGNAAIGTEEAQVAIPKDAPVDEAITVNWKSGSAEHADVSTLVITPDNTPFNEDSFTKSDSGESLEGSLYQTAIGADGKVFATSSVGRPPVSESYIYKLDPDTLAVELKHEAEIYQSADEREDGKDYRWAAYGIGTDNTSNNAVGEPLVWVTNTRQNEISVYKQSDLSFVARSTDGALAHGRDVVVDQKTGIAYASSSSRGSDAAGVIEAFTVTKNEDGSYAVEKDRTIALEDFPVTMSIDFDQENGVLYTTSLNETKAVAVHVRDGDKTEYYNLDSENAASGIAYDPVGKNIYMPTQDGNDVIVVNTVSGKTIARISTGAQALNSVYSSANGLVYVVNRTGGTVTVLNAYDPAGEAGGPVKLANLTIGKNANHVTVTDEGVVYATDKDRPTKVHRIEPGAELSQRPEVLTNSEPSEDNNYGLLKTNPSSILEGTKDEVTISFGKENFWDGQIADLVAEKEDSEAASTGEKAAKEDSASVETTEIAKDITVDSESGHLVKADLSGLSVGTYKLVARGKHGNVLAWTEFTVTSLATQGGDSDDANTVSSETDKPSGDTSTDGSASGTVTAEVTVEGDVSGEVTGIAGTADSTASDSAAPSSQASGTTNQAKGDLAKTGASNAAPMLLGLLAAAVIAAGAILIRRNQNRA